ncbi:MAG: phosphorylase, partial [Lachnospiraceae bacterium]|nr:phosphorylase [Lachnospiraceae bacterium]
AYLAFGLDQKEHYDALVVAPSFSPYKLKMDRYCRVTTLKEGAYLAGYLVEKDGLKLAWIKTASSDSNLIDHVAVCAELTFDKMIFIGAVGALKPEFALGDLCTPSYSIAGGFAHTYLKDSIKDFVPFERVEPDMEFVDRIVGIAEESGFELKKASVFCTPSIAAEYYHIEEIKEFDTDLIEMETDALYFMADLLEIPTVALLVVSDNSATGAALVGRTEEEQEKYDYGRNEVLPEMILRTAEIKR